MPVHYLQKYGLLTESLFYQRTKNGIALSTIKPRKVLITILNYPVLRRENFPTYCFEKSMIKQLVTIFEAVH